MSYADVERVCFDAVKACIIQGQGKIDRSIFEAALKQQKERLHVRADAFGKNGK
jgi:hypothetical protein